MHRYICVTHAQMYQCVSNYFLRRAGVCLSVFTFGRTYVNGNCLCVSVRKWACSQQPVHGCACTNLRARVQKCVYTGLHERVRVHEYVCTNSRARECAYDWARICVRPRFYAASLRTLVCTSEGVCMRLHEYVYISIRQGVCLYTNVCGLMRICIHLYSYARVHTRMCVHIHTCVLAEVCVSTWVCIVLCVIMHCS